LARFKFLIAAVLQLPFKNPIGITSIDRTPSTRFVGSPISRKPDHSEADQQYDDLRLVAAQQLNW